MLESIAAPIESAIRGSALVVTHNLEKVQLSATVGYIEGTITFIDNSRLVFFEFLRQTDDGVQREKYRYHYMEVMRSLSSVTITPHIILKLLLSQTTNIY